MNGPHAVFRAGKLKSREATPFKYTFQAITVTAGQRVIGHLMPRGKLGFEAYDEAGRSIGIFSNQRLATYALSEAAS